MPRRKFEQCHKSTVNRASGGALHPLHERALSQISRELSGELDNAVENAVIIQRQSTLNVLQPSRASRQTRENRERDRETPQAHSAQAQSQAQAHMCSRTRGYYDYDKVNVNEKAQREQKKNITTLSGRRSFQPS